MTENKGDLISREALKEEVENLIGYSLSYEAILNAIDNAPTVETYPFEQVQELVKLNQQFAQEIENLKRPQGEWILNKDENPECPFCHHSFTYWGNFCGNCGADMQNGEKK